MSNPLTKFARAQPVWLGLLGTQLSSLLLGWQGSFSTPRGMFGLGATC